MAHPFILLGLVIAGGIGSGFYLNRAGASSPEGAPKIGGMNATTIVTVGGLALAFLGLPLISPLALGASIGAAVSGDGLKQAREGIEAVVARVVAERVGPGGGGGMPPAPPALPGPVDNAPGQFNPLELLAPAA